MPAFVPGSGTAAVDRKDRNLCLTRFWGSSGQRGQCMNSVVRNGGTEVREVEGRNDPEAGDEMSCGSREK